MLANIDVSGYKDENGEYSGVIWLMAEFDIEMDKANYVGTAGSGRSGKGVNFYRWLDEALQTEELLNGGTYSETIAYNENVAYYALYQDFEILSAKN